MRVIRLVGKATTDTLTNKTLASPVITGSLAVGTLTNSGTDITLDSSGDIVLDADGGQIYFKDGEQQSLLGTLAVHRTLFQMMSLLLKLTLVGLVCSRKLAIRTFNKLRKPSFSS